jgi:2-polyprenyl-6-methoxyphenol hydroxylase-like FAD-dependent oxidoreductase
MYDVIIVGARVAGSATALLLSRRGLTVLVLDRATFPSDTLSTHQVQVPGVAALARWGVLDRVLAADTPPTRRVRFQQGPVVLHGKMPSYQGVDFMCSPRRTVLDATLVQAAREAGAQVREDVTVEQVLVERGRVVGVRGRSKAGSPFLERATLVVGADGKNSTVAKAVGAGTYRVRPTQTMAYYTYFAGVPVEGGEMYGGAGRAVGLWPTNDGLVLAYLAWPRAEFDEFRRDVEGNFLASLDSVGIGERIRAGRRAERLRGTPDLPSFFRQPHGPGWALVGDAGVVLDPITGRGITDAFHDAELLTDAITAGLAPGGRLDRALTRYQRRRDRAARPMYDFTAQLAALRPVQPAELALFRALARSQADTDQFIAAITGALPLRRFMSPANLIRLVGVAGFARLAAGPSRRPAGPSRRPAEPARGPAGSV